MISDSHAHLQDERLGDATAVLAGARAAGVGRVVCCGTSERDWPRVAALAAEFPDIVQPAFGLHPWFIRYRSPRWREELERLLELHPAAAVGEIGLDRAVEDRDDAAQEEVFGIQLRMARTLQRPVSVHGRQSWARLLEMLTAEGPHPAGVVLHSFSGPPELVPDFSALNCYFSFSGAATRSNNRRAHRALAAAPLDRILLESDAPDLPMAGLPIPTDGSRPISVPAHLPRMARILAVRRGITAELLLRHAEDNAGRVFGRSIGA